MKKELVSFANYTHSDYRKAKYELATETALENGFNIEPTEYRLKEVSDADIDNWKARESQH
jgi:hypothetical protein